jgi:hypothetical protein
MKRLLIITFIFLFSTCGSNVFSQPISFDFKDIPAEDTFDISTNFSGTLSECGTSCVLFSIYNNGPVSSFIGQVYFDDLDGSPVLSDGAFSSINSSGLHNLGGVWFENNSNLVLPQGNNISFDTDFGFGANQPGTGQQGVDVGEMAGFLFTGNYDDVVAALFNEDLRIGLHVQGILPDTFDGSDSYVNTSPVPIPTTLLLLGSGLVGIGGLRRKLKK